MVDETQDTKTPSNAVAETDDVEKKANDKKAREKKAKQKKSSEKKTDQEKTEGDDAKAEERTKFRKEVRDLIDAAQGRLRLFNEYGVFQSSDKEMSDSRIDARDVIVAKLAEARTSLADDKLEAAHDAALEAELALEDSLYVSGSWRGIKRKVIRYQPFLLLWYLVVLGLLFWLSLAAGGDGDGRDVRLWQTPADSQVAESANRSPKAEEADGERLNQAEEPSAPEAADSPPEVPAQESATEERGATPSGEAPTETETPEDDLAGENPTDGPGDVLDETENIPTDATDEAGPNTEAATDDGSERRPNGNGADGPADSPSGSGIPLAALLAGGLGAVLRGLWWLWFKVARWELRINYRLAHLCAPFIGLLLGLFAYLAVTGGLLILEGVVTGSVEVTSHPSAGMLLVCFFAGYNWEGFLRWINQLMERRFANGEDNGNGK